MDFVHGLFRPTRVVGGRCVLRTEYTSTSSLGRGIVSTGSWSGTLAADRIRYARCSQLLPYVRKGGRPASQIWRNRYSMLHASVDPVNRALAAHMPVGFQTNNTRV